MTELEWPPSVMAGMTIPQLICLVDEKAPSKRRTSSAEEMLAAAARLEAEEKEWRGS